MFSRFALLCLRCFASIRSCRVRYLWDLFGNRKIRNRGKQVGEASYIVMSQGINILVIIEFKYIKFNYF
jgi:hypothetical protein